MSTNGKPIPPMTDADLRRFWAKVTMPDPETGCMNWLAGTNSDGYGQFWLQGTLYRAHRISWTLANGPIPAGLVLDHVVCRNKACVNPAHLRICSVKENNLAPDGSMRMLAERERSKTRCPSGHEYTAENTYHNPPSKSNPNGGRKCRTCHRERERARRLRKRLASTDSTGQLLMPTTSHKELDAS